MQVTFLGTGTSQGVPIIGCKCSICTSDNPLDKRLRSSILIEVDGNHIVIDTGPDFRQQMLRQNVNKLDAVVFTHAHKDHIAGFDDIRAYNFVLKRKMDVYADARVEKALRREFYYIFEDTKYPGIPEINLHHFENTPFNVCGIKFTPIEVMHMNLPVYGFRINDFTYITDANFISEEEKKKIKGSKVLVLNALRRTEHPSHFTFNEAIKLAQELNCEKTYFTHISHQLGLHLDVTKELPTGIELAYDGLKVTI